VTGVDLPPGAVEVMRGGGEMGALMRSTNWGDTHLGPPETWPQSLRTAVGLLLESRFPMYLAWGSDFVQFYNDWYRPILGSTKHPAALGGRAQDTFAESWHIIGPMFEGVMRGTAVGAEDWMLPLDRHGYLEECYFTFSYSPIRDEGGGVGGVHVTVTETTARVIGERRLRTLRDLAARAGGAQREEDAWQGSVQALGGNPFDVPFALLYRRDDPSAPPRLVASAGWEGLEPTDPAAATEWPFATSPAREQTLLVSDLIARCGELPGGRWPEPPRTAMVLPISRPGGDNPFGFLVAGLSPRRALDDDYRGFLGLVADQIATSVGSARAHDEEKQRAAALAEIDRAKTAFFSNVSHEFRTPLTLMLGPIEDGLADEQEPLSARQRERHEIMRRNGLRLQKLVNTLLDFTRVEAGRAQASFLPTDLAGLTADLASSFDSAFAKAGLRFVCDCPPLPAPVAVDPAMWEKIVLNLLSNALKFTFEGQVRLSLRWHGAEVELRVEDTGTGIPPEELPRIFDRFHRVEGARGRSHEGTGIGLALVQELVKLHGGQVTVQSALGQGTSFGVILPTGPTPAATQLPSDLIAPRPVPGPAPAPTRLAAAFLAEVSQWNAWKEPVSRDRGPAASSSPPAAPSPGAGARILVADDNPDMRAYLERLLSHQWSVETVTDGHQAIAAARANPPDLVLSDVMMPGMDGLDLVRALRADERTQTIPIVLLSARAGEEATIEGLNQGADEYLIKPFSANELQARVRAQLAVSRLRREALRVERAHVDEARRLLAEAERAKRSREEVLSIVSHDLRSPLGAIRTAAEILKRTWPDQALAARVHKGFEVIRRSVERMDRLLGDLLDLASIDAGNLSLDLQQHTAEALVDEIRETFEAEAADHAIALEAWVAPGLPPISCDGERVVQVLGNLVSNALKFTPAGGAVQVRAEADGEHRMRFSVADTGPGIPTEMQAHIFDRYWQAAHKNRSGIGLGLSIAKGIVEGHRGQLALDSTPGAGSTFSFALPLSQLQEIDGASAAPGDSVEPASARTLSGTGARG